MPSLTGRRLLLRPSAVANSSGGWNPVNEASVEAALDDPVEAPGFEVPGAGDAKYVQSFASGGEIDWLSLTVPTPTVPAGEFIRSFRAWVLYNLHGSGNMEFIAKRGNALDFTNPVSLSSAVYGSPGTPYWVASGVTPITWDQYAAAAPYADLRVTIKHTGAGLPGSPSNLNLEVAYIEAELAYKNPIRGAA